MEGKTQRARDAESDTKKEREGGRERESERERERGCLARWNKGILFNVLFRF